MESTALHVETHGAGPAIVLAHGFGGSARNWRPQVRALRDRHTVVTFDARGHARSPAPDDAAAYRPEAAVADFQAVVAGCGDPHPAVGGLSMGAAVALAFAAAHPSVPRGLVLASFPAGPASGRGISASAAAFADAIDREGLEAAGARFAWGPGSGLDPQGAALVRQGFLEHAPHALAHTLREHLARLDEPAAWAERLRRLPCPILLIAGARDHPSLSACEHLAAASPRARLEVLADAGHVVNLAAPVAYNAAVERFLRQLPPAPQD